MITVSSAFKTAMQVRTNFTRSAVVTLADGTVLQLGNNDFTISGNRLSDSAGGGALPVGMAICRTVELELVNNDDRYAGTVFTGAEIVLTLGFNTGAAVETVSMGTFTVRQPGTYGTTVTLTAMDDMYKAEHYFETALTYPATAFALFEEICAACGIEYTAASIPAGSFMVQTAPSSELTYRQVLGYIAMLSGGSARISRQRKLEIVNYDFASLAAARAEGAAPAGGHDLTMWKNLRSDREDFVITGVETTVTDSGGNVEILTAGTAGNVLPFVNPLIAGNEEAALALIGGAVIGAAYRPFSGEHIAYPLAEFGDIARVSDGLGRVFWTVITDVDFVWNSVTTLGASSRTADLSASGTMEQNLTRIAADLAQFARLKVSWADIQEALINNLVLYGFMDVYEDSSLQESGGKIGYATGSNTFGGGIAIEHVGDGGEGYGYNVGAVVVGDKATFIGAGKGINFDGGVDVSQENFDQYILMNASDVEENWPTIEISVGASNENNTVKEPSIILSLGDATPRLFRPVNTFNGYSEFEHLSAPEIGDIDDLTTTDKSSLVDAVNELDGEKVDKSGDTMTGALTVTNNSNIVSKNTGVTVGAVPASDQYWNGVQSVDNSNNSLGRVRGIYLTTDRSGMELYASRTVSGSTVYNALRLLIDNSGNRYVSISDAAPWRNALGLGNTSGALPVANGGTGATNAATALSNLGGASWVSAGTAASGTGTTFTLPSSGTYLLSTGHNSTAGLNGLWIYRTAGSLAVNIGGGGSVTIAGTGTSVKVTPSSGSPNFAYMKMY